MCDEETNSKDNIVIKLTEEEYNEFKDALAWKEEREANRKHGESLVRELNSLKWLDI